MTLPDQLRDAIIACATRRVQVRDVPRGLRVSTPVPTSDGHLVELSFYLVGRRLIAGDAGDFMALARSLSLSDESTILDDALEEFRLVGFELDDKGELMQTVTADDAGCISLDFAAAWARATAIVEDEGRHQPRQYEAYIYHERFQPVTSFVKRGVTLEHGVKIPFYAPQPRAAIVAVGSFGTTVDPVRVATLQLSPLYRLLAHDDTRAYRRVAVVKPEYYAIAEVRERVDEAAKTPILETEMHKLYGLVRGNASLAPG